MSNLSAPIGAIVRVWFPESELVMARGPKLRPCIVLAEEVRNGRQMVLVAYGTSQNTHWNGRGEFTIQEGVYKGITKKTRFNCKRVLWLPLTREFFGGQQPEPLRDADLKLCVQAAREAAIF